MGDVVRAIEVDPLWATSIVSEVTGVPVTTLRWWRHNGRGPKSFRLGERKVVYRRSDVLEWIATQEQGQSA